jgi:hypothetical protein
MEHRAIASLAIRIVGFYELIAALNGASTIVANIFSTTLDHTLGPQAIIAAVVGSVLFPLFVGLFLINYPAIVTWKVLRIEGLDSREPRDQTLLESVAIGAIGIWFCANAIITVAYQLALVFTYPMMESTQTLSEAVWAMRLRLFSIGIAEAAQFVIGLWLLLGSQALARLLSRLRVRRVDNQSASSHE